MRMREIVMYGGVKTQVDDEDYEAASQITWHAERKGHLSYAGIRMYFRDEKLYRKVYLHRWLLKPPRGMVVDHIDGDGLNNQRSNLRICTQAENARNMRKHGDGKYRFKGVHSYGKLYEAYITYNRNRYYLGAYATEEEAGAAYNAAALEFFGEYANLNMELPMDQKPPDSVPTFSEWVKKNMPGFSLVASKVPGEQEVQHGRQDERGEGAGGRPDEEGREAPEPSGAGSLPPPA